MVRKATQKKKFNLADVFGGIFELILMFIVLFGLLFSYIQVVTSEDLSVSLTEAITIFAFPLFVGSVFTSIKSSQKIYSFVGERLIAAGVLFLVGFLATANVFFLEEQYGLIEKAGLNTQLWFGAALTVAILAFFVGSILLSIALAKICLHSFRVAVGQVN